MSTVDPNADGKPRPPEWYAKDFAQKGWDYYGRDHYRWRNLVLAEMIRKLQPKRVFEFAGAEGDLAELILQKCPWLERYAFTDFCEDAVEHAKQRLGRFQFRIERGDLGVTCTKMDVNADYRKVGWGNFDLVASTALEHIQNDNKIIEAIPKGTYVALCLPAALWEGHVRCFPTWQSIRERYPSLKILDACTLTVNAKDTDYNKKFVFTAVKT